MEELYVLNDKLDLSKKLVIFGTGQHAKETYLQLISRGIKPDYFADRKEELIGLKLFGIEIISEKSLENFECQIIVASTAWENICNRLTDKGLKQIYVDKNRYAVNGLEL